MKPSWTRIYPNSLLEQLAVVLISQPLFLPYVYLWWLDQSWTNSFSYGVQLSELWLIWGLVFWVLVQVSEHSRFMTELGVNNEEMIVFQPLSSKPGYFYRNWKCHISTFWFTMYLCTCSVIEDMHGALGNGGIRYWGGGGALGRGKNRKTSIINKIRWSFAGGIWFASMCFLCRILMGIGAGMIWSTGIPLLTSLAPAYAGRITSLVESGAGFGIAIGPPIGSAVSNPTVFVKLNVQITDLAILLWFIL